MFAPQNAESGQLGSDIRLQLYQPKNKLDCFHSTARQPFVTGTRTLKSLSLFHHKSAI
ncbi:uncharacterized protein METZ01_LOCUS159797 [marine metagenome]|uniref:Uncharacterized protein n=1 Tax=marine metagenome TaxID=408172 RepID=A0A382B0Z9_9ZZZZ